VSIPIIVLERIQPGQYIPLAISLPAPQPRAGPGDRRADRLINMTIVLKHLGVRQTVAVDAMIEQRMLELLQGRVIDRAEVTLRRQYEASPDFQVAIAVEMPGLDQFASGEDSTLRAAALKALNQLEKGLAARDRKPGRRLKSKLQAHAAKTGRWPSAGRVSS